MRGLFYLAMHALRGMRNTFVVAFAFLHCPSIHQFMPLLSFLGAMPKKNRVVVSLNSVLVLDQILYGGLCQTLFSESNRITEIKDSKRWMIYLHDIYIYIFHISETPNHQHDFVKKIIIIKFAPPPKDCPIYILLAADDGQRIVRVYVPLASIVLPLFSLTYPYPSSHLFFHLKDL